MLLFDILELIVGLFIGLLKFIFGLLEKALDVVLALLSFIFSIVWPVVQFILNLLFGWLKKIIDDIIKALLLLEFEKLLKKKAKLAKSLEEDSETLGELVDLIGELLDSGFEQRFKHKSAESLVESFDVSKLSKYGDIKRKALEYEKTVFRCFVVRQKLKLYDIDGRLDETQE